MNLEKLVKLVEQTSETGKGRGMIDTGHHSNLVSFIHSQKEKTTTNMCIVQARLARRSLCNTLVSAKRYPTHTWTQVFTVVIFFTIIIMFIYDNASNFDGNCFDGDYGLINENDRPGPSSSTSAAFSFSRIRWEFNFKLDKIGWGFKLEKFGWQFDYKLEKVE